MLSCLHLLASCNPLKSSEKLGKGCSTCFSSTSSHSLAAQTRSGGGVALDNQWYGGNPSPTDGMAHLKMKFPGFPRWDILHSYPGGYMVCGGSFLTEGVFKVLKGKRCVKKTQAADIIKRY